MDSVWMRRAAVLVGTGAMLLVLQAEAHAQSLGVGPHFTFVRNEVGTGSGQRFNGGAIRLRTSPRTALEFSFDFRTYMNDSLTERIKDSPIHASLVMFPVRTTFSPYVVAGVGWYKETIEQLVADDVVGTTEARKTGYHAGLGGEIWLGRRAALHLDYRYTFIRFGSADEGSESGALPLPGLGSIQDRLRLSHQGSVWTMGILVYM